MAPSTSITTTTTTKAAANRCFSPADEFSDEEDDQLIILHRPRRARKYKSVKLLMRMAKRVELPYRPEDYYGVVDDDVDDHDSGNGGDGEDDKYSELGCEECGSGERADQILICDKCDRGFHMNCLRPIVTSVPPGSWSCPNCTDPLPQRPEFKSLTQTTIMDFFGLQKCTESMEKLDSVLGMRRKRRRNGSLVFHKKSRRLLPYVPVEDESQRLRQMQSLASALMAMNINFSSELTYMPGMAPRSANKARLEKGGMQVLSKEDFGTLQFCNAMGIRGLCPPLMVVYDAYEGYTVEADGPIKDLTLIAEYAGDVDYLKKREHDNCDSLMTLLLAKNPSRSLVICPDKRGNIARFINGINNHLPESRKRQNLKCVRYNVNGECRVLLVATRDIAKGERLYYDYNGHEYEYPTHMFI
ncbi:OLC1v1008716C1 [Oldenlandia corymbosa var. corymbosa]|uniref:[histone H3]-lysine(27) N-methyltransferase n=1 Tax=Oldenlandia corymbosa var. corymbosa TaxID=529605 RepID=A0AAV1DPN4_OLDCO|nr:OLC1v1008716C1 [Oldenlandia corymbosa var. corymbosa]